MKRAGLGWGRGGVVITAEIERLVEKSVEKHHDHKKKASKAHTRRFIKNLTRLNNKKCAHSFVKKRLFITAKKITAREKKHPQQNFYSFSAVLYVLTFSI